MSWADVIVPVGGDGTFLLSANRASPLFALSQQKTPIVGFNSDPQHSEGRLMLPKQYSENPEEAVDRIKHVSSVHALLMYHYLIVIPSLPGCLQVDASLAHTHHAAGQQWQDSRVDGPVQAHHCQNGASEHITGTAGRENGHQVQGQNEASIAVSGAERGKPRKAGR